MHRASNTNKNVDRKQEIGINNFLRGITTLGIAIGYRQLNVIIIVVYTHGTRIVMNHVELNTCQIERIPNLKYYKSHMYSELHIKLK